VQFSKTTKNQAFIDKYRAKSFQLISWRTLLGLVLSLIVLNFFWKYNAFIKIFVGGWLASQSFLLFEPIQIQTYFVAVLFSVPLIVIFTLLARSKLHAFVSTVLMLTFWAIITSNYDVSAALRFYMEMSQELWVRSRTLRGNELSDFYLYRATPD